MAEEITADISLSLANGSLEHSFRPGSQTLDQSGTHMLDQTLDIGTSEETIAFTDIATKGWIALQNLDATNYVEYGPDNTTLQVFGKLEAGETHSMRISDSATLKMKADTATCRVRFIALED